MHVKCGFQGFNLGHVALWWVPSPAHVSSYINLFVLLNIAVDLFMSRETLGWG